MRERKKIHTINNWLVVEPTHLKNMIVKLGSSSPNFGLKINTISNHHLEMLQFPGNRVEFQLQKIVDNPGCHPKKKHLSQQSIRLKKAVGRTQDNFIHFTSREFSWFVFDTVISFSRVQLMDGETHQHSSFYKKNEEKIGKFQGNVVLFSQLPGLTTTSDNQKDFWISNGFLDTMRFPFPNHMYLNWFCWFSRFTWFIQVMHEFFNKNLSLPMVTNQFSTKGAHR